MIKQKLEKAHPYCYHTADGKIFVNREILSNGKKGGWLVRINGNIVWRTDTLAQARESVKDIKNEW